MTVLALAGGVGGAKLANGLAQTLPPGELRVVVNTGDDFEHLGLTVCPDIDSVTYALAGMNNVEQGWGVADETWAFMDQVRRLGGADWFRLGDRDLAMHVLRTQALRRQTLSQVTAEITASLGIRQAIVPMSDDPVRSIIVTDEGDLPFQDYFVRRQCQPRFRAIRLEGLDSARPSPGFLAALDDPALEAIVLCPSNPLLSIEPILALAGVRARLRARRVPCIALSPFIGGRAVKGPAAKIMAELGLSPTPAALAGHYGGLIDALVIDRADDSGARQVDGVALSVTDTLMRDPADQGRLAREILALIPALAALRP